MSWFAIYRLDTGALQSVGTVLASPLPDGLAARDVGKDQPDGRWNPAALRFEALAANPRLLTKLEFRQLFANEKRQLVDEFNASFEGSLLLGAEQKRAVRTGLKDFENASGIAVPLEPSVLAMLALYQGVGILTAADVAAILAGAERG